MTVTWVKAAARSSSAPHGWGLRVERELGARTPAHRMCTHSSQLRSGQRGRHFRARHGTAQLLQLVCPTSSLFPRASPPEISCADRRHLSCPPQAKKIFRRRPGMRFPCGIWVPGSSPAADMHLVIDGHGQNDVTCRSPAASTQPAQHATAERKRWWCHACRELQGRL